MEMWSHPSFYPIFEEILVKAIAADSKLNFTFEEHIKDDLVAEPITRSVAEQFVLSYQIKVLNEEKILYLMKTA